MSAPRAVIYGRVSKKKAEGKSVDGQLAELREWAGREGWTIVAEHRDDGISASKYANGKVRDGWVSTTELITARKVDLLVVWEISRATRDRVAWSALLSACQVADVKIATGGRVHDPNDPDDGFMMDLQAALAVQESARTSKRILRTVRLDAAAGKPYGKIPYGYRRVYDPHTGKLLRQEPDPETGPIVREIAKRLLSGEALYSVAQDLNGRGVVSPREWERKRNGKESDPTGQWDFTQVKRAAISPTNAGMRLHKGTVVPATWDALISEQDHHILKAKLTDPSRRTSRDGGVKHLLSGIAECGVCGGSVRAKKNNGHDSYVCVGDRSNRRQHVSRSEDAVDAYVTETVLRELEKPDWRPSFATGDDGKVAEAAAEAEALRAQRDKFMDDAVDLGLGAVEVKRYLDRINAKIEDAERRARVQLGSPLLDELAGPGARKRWEGLMLSARREVVRALVRVRVLKIGKGIRPPAMAGAVDWQAVTAWTESIEIIWR